MRFGGGEEDDEYKKYLNERKEKLQNSFGIKWLTGMDPWGEYQLEYDPISNPNPSASEKFRTDGRSPLPKPEDLAKAAEGKGNFAANLETKTHLLFPEKEVGFIKVANDLKNAWGKERQDEGSFPSRDGDTFLNELIDEAVEFKSKEALNDWKKDHDIPINVEGVPVSEPWMMELWEEGKRKMKDGIEADFKEAGRLINNYNAIIPNIAWAADPGSYGRHENKYKELNEELYKIYIIKTLFDNIYEDSTWTYEFRRFAKPNPKDVVASPPFQYSKKREKRWKKDREKRKKEEERRKKKEERKKARKKKEEDDEDEDDDDCRDPCASGCPEEGGPQC
tara:strand:- start:112 stop:1119 length:1008 start_codon:yes stop_codon:yes gene_type:complete